jgi:hypothetical protein
MSLAIIIDLIFSAFVLIAIPGMLGWAIWSSRIEHGASGRRLRAPKPAPRRLRGTAPGALIDSAS